MKKYIITILFLAVTLGVSAGEKKTPAERKELRKQNDIAWRQRAKYAFGVHTGIDIGAAAPFPLDGMNASSMSAVPKLNPALGVSFTTFPWSRFTMTIETTYKQVGIDAQARVNGQKFTLINNGGKTVTEFIGLADVKMSFSMLEIPFYVGYSFASGRNRVLLGGYYSHIFKSNFATVPVKGVVRDPNDPNDEGLSITPDNPVPPGTMPEFNDYLGKWDAGVLVGYEWQVFPRVNLSARLSVGLKDIFKKGNNYLEFKMLHMRGTVSLSYSFLRYLK